MRKTSGGPFLTGDQERELFREYRRTPSMKLEERILRSQLGLVGTLAKQHHVRGIDRQDLYQEGVLALLTAIRRFDPSRGVRLSTYAAFWIRAYMFRYTMRNLKLVRIGTTQAQRRILFRVTSLRARLSAAGLEPTAGRLATILGVDATCVAETEARLHAGEISLDLPVHDDPQRLRIDAVVAVGAPADEALADDELLRLFRAERDRFRASLSPRRRVLFDARWTADTTPTLQEMGDRLGVSRERARQIERDILVTLAKRVRARIAA